MDDRLEGIGSLRLINWISDAYDDARIGRDETDTSSVQTPVGARPALWLNLEY